MDWNGVKTFLAIAQHGSLAAAARALGVNHSTVYRRLQAFEDEINSKLFFQQGNQYTLTAAGEELFSQGQSIQAQFDAIQRSLVGKEQKPSGVVRITAPFNLANQVIPVALNDFRRHYPEIQLEILSTNEPLNLNSRIADIAVRATSHPPQHLIGKKVCSYPWGFYSNQSYLKKVGAVRELADLSQHKLIGGAGNLLDLPAFSWLEKHYAANITTRCDELTAMSYFAESHHGLALLPADQARKGLKLILPVPDIEPSHVWLLTHPDLRKTERVRLVMEALTHHFKQLG